MPGSPESDEAKTRTHKRRRLHPGASIYFCVGLLLALSFVQSPWLLAAAAVVLMAAALRVERRPLRGEAPLLVLALIVFAAHLFLGGKPPREALRPAGEVALRLLALLYLIRWAARAVLPHAARWLFGRRGPRRPRALALLFESGRLTLALLPLALGEAERQHVALRARAVRPGPGIGGRARYVAAWFLPYLGTMLRMGDAYGEALHARGYAMGAPRRGAVSFKWGAAESALLLATSLAAAWLIRAR